jgi:DNA-binding FadR family transcriptional regulator
MSAAGSLAARERRRRWHEAAQAKALAMIAAAAEEGQPCPSNDALEGALGCSRPTLYAVLAALENAGQLVLLRRGGPATRRVYFVPQSNKTTARQQP